MGDQQLRSNDRLTHRNVSVDIDDAYRHHRPTSAPRKYARSTIPSVCRKLGAFFLGRAYESSTHCPTALGEAGTRELREFIAAWREITERDVNIGLRQKGVDMRIGLDIATMTLKHQVDTLILVTGDSDFVPAAKLARREGVEFLLDPLWQQVSDELNEHVDGVVSAFSKPAADTSARIAA